jgi:UDP-N-acetylglucosamine 3-dehydrogenase
VSTNTATTTTATTTTAHATTLRAGLVGLGMMGRNHARVLASLDGVRLVGIADPHPSADTTTYAAPLVPDVETLIGLGLDYCVVAAPTALHESVGAALAEAGVHALIEKPLAPDSPAAERLSKLFADRGLIGGVGHIERFNPALQEMRRRLDAGQLGDVFQVVTRRQGPFPARIADVGVVMDLATHDIDLTTWVTRRAYTTVAAHTAHRSGRDHEDLVAVVGGLEDGTVASHLVNWLSPMKERVTVVTGERGCYVADTLTADLTFYANSSVPTEWEALQNFRGVTQGDIVRYAIAKPEPLRAEHEAFRDAVRGLGAQIVTFEEGVRTVRTAEALLNSAICGQRVAVD